MGMEELLGDISKHHEMLCKQVHKHVGKERGTQVLADIPTPTGEETPEQRAQWAALMCECLERSLDADAIIRIRQECACVKSNKYSAYNQKYFPRIRAENPYDEDYLKSVAEFLSGRPRIGRNVEYVDGKLITHLGEGRGCGCFVIKGGWEKPPSTTWCRCCQGTLFSVYQFVFPDKTCHMELIETHATGGEDCVFSAWYTDQD